MTGNEKSLNTQQTYSAASRLKDQGVAIYTVGLRFRDSTELDAISSEPADDYRILVSDEEEVRRVPTLFKSRIDRGSAFSDDSYNYGLIFL